jgi:hypothetical protein
MDSSYTSEAYRVNTYVDLIMVYAVNTGLLTRFVFKIA